MSSNQSEKEPIIAQLQALLDESVAAGVPGISAAIQTSTGTQWDLSAGYADIQTKAAIDKTTAFGIGSITKPFVAVLTLQLVQEGRLNLSDHAKSLLSADVLHGIQHAEEATIAQLLSHTGGITSWEDDRQWQKDGRGENIQPSKIWQKSETLDYVRRAGEDTGLKPGPFHYANTNYTLLGLIIEEITKSTAEAEIRRRILEPLQMADTYFEGFEQPRVDRTPHRYHWSTPTFHQTAGFSPHHKPVRDDLVDVTGTNLSVSWTAGGMISTPTDLLKFANGLREGKLLNAQSMAALMDWQPAFENIDMGRGVSRLRDSGLPGTWVGHNGGVLGFTAAWWWDYEGTCAVSVLANVGSSHAGDVPSHAARVAIKTKFLRLAAELAALG
ncbi:beta-lactamase/transpeptidase-like protein [Neohortaea acidophila]|uniref:Beta-lactamase/transpeptidase-like protein n=1 Tax=Neohortaea acidophila TaxID=245834 RepID=A0A6A6PXJ5_9PEZI|nr:beta-lactamase/transpeptidase-like protein [Neohortaea acidophila]KAF2484735.1 beta-lactamase/transpeptidase-like protein [Neohortaea acidophila]